MNLLISWAVLTFALWVASALLPGMKIKGGPISHFIVAGLYGLLSVFLGWIVFLVIGLGTLGLGFVFAFLTRLVVGAIMLKVTDALSDRIQIRGFGTAFLAALIVSVVGTVSDYALHHAHLHFH